ncbi:hypothetical protein ACPTC0_004676 [Escherichia coli]|jgi:hypothetical protein|nr:MULTISPECIES: hypothetical protein [Enterobacteriaceae]EFA8811033.1 hypothetical protein [Escherichia coli O8:H49]EGF2690837.1 hypothetical protein [Shigella sonnei]EEW2040094.1 hypothetical protein [Escherichia coli]EFA7679405.1 hypothetical protein [Escherichia coli]EFC4551981.1 hypothetical protein [Escherichia coli]
MDFFRKTFGGLNSSYYFRQLVFGGAIAAFLIWLGTQTNHGINIPTIMIIVANAFIYPYSRFVYESIVSFIMGDNVFYINAIFMLSVKLGMMLACWFFAFCIAPVGLIYLYFVHSKQSQTEQE